MTATGSAPVTTKSTQAADYPVATDSFAPLMANSSTSYFESSNISRAETSARPFQLTTESLFHASGRPVRTTQFTTFCSVRMIRPLLLVVLCSCSCYRPSYSSDHWPYYRSCCWSSFCLASCCIVQAHHDLLPTGTLQRPESVANLWNTRPVARGGSRGFGRTPPPL